MQTKVKIFVFLIIVVFPLFTSATGDSLLIVRNISLEGNKVTKDIIILREMLYSVGDTISKKNLSLVNETCRENILNTGLFNFVDIEYNISQEYIDIKIVLVERWYIWPMPILEHADRNISSFLHYKDWSKINYGGFVVIQNFRGRNEDLLIKVRAGYKEQYGFMYIIPSFDKKRRHGLAIDASYFRQHEVAYQTKDNLLEYYNNPNKYVREFGRTTLRYQYRPSIYNYHKLYLQFHKGVISDSITSLNPYYLNTDTNKYQYLGLTYNYILDKRDIQYYPLDGYFLSGSINKKGLIFNEIDNLNFKLDARYYHKLHNRFYFGQQFAGKYSVDKKQPYYIIEGLGYGKTLRGYEYYVLDGTDYVFSKTNFRYQLLSEKVFNIKFIPWSQFNKIHFAIYLNTYFDMGYVNNEYPGLNNDMLNSWQYSTGLGIDLVSYYDTVFRVEYSVNKYGMSGFFLHLGTGI